MTKLKRFRLDGHMQEVLKGASATLMIWVFGKEQECLVARGEHSPDDGLTIEKLTLESCLV